MKTLSWKDFLIGTLVGAMLLMLIGAGTGNKKNGRYLVAVGGDDDGYSVCVTDSLTGHTKCKDRQSGKAAWEFKPDFNHAGR